MRDPHVTARQRPLPIPPRDAVVARLRENAREATFLRRLLRLLDWRAEAEPQRGAARA